MARFASPRWRQRKGEVELTSVRAGINCHQRRARADACRLGVDSARNLVRQVGHHVQFLMRAGRAARAHKLARARLVSESAALERPVRNDPLGISATEGSNGVRARGGGPGARGCKENRKDKAEPTQTHWSWDESSGVFRADSPGGRTQVHSANWQRTQEDAWYTCMILECSQCELAADSGGCVVHMYDSGVFTVRTGSGLRRMRGTHV